MLSTNHARSSLHIFMPQSCIVQGSTLLNCFSHAVESRTLVAAGRMIFWPLAEVTVGHPQQNRHECNFLCSLTSVAQFKIICTLKLISLVRLSLGLSLCRHLYFLIFCKFFQEHRTSEQIACQHASVSVVTALAPFSLLLAWFSRSIIILFLDELVFPFFRLSVFCCTDASFQCLSLASGE